MYDTTLWDTQQINFKANPKENAQPFSLLLPPPNITGHLHLGHLLNSTIQDMLHRRAISENKNTIWLPGTDHATTATQTLLEKQLAKDGKTRHDLTRQEFMDYGEKWRKYSGGEIIKQLKGLNMSLDFTKERYTMDQKYSQAIKTAFKKLYDDKLIYRAERLISFSPKLGSALSDLEIERIDEKTNLYYLNYPIKDHDPLLIATTQLHSIAGDTALILNPNHPRASELLSQFAINPLTKELMPIYLDDSIDLSFGTGAIKCTPAHDKTDYELAQKHNLPLKIAFDLTGQMTDLYPAWSKLLIEEARSLAEAELKEFVFKIEEHTQPIPRCERTGCRIETLPAMQWWLDTKPLATPIIKALKNDQIKITPASQKDILLSWLEKGRPWCLSRQLTWGHQIPMWQDKTGNWHSEMAAGRIQDPDILDTWFSSALWSFAALGWPNQTDLLENYPLTAMISGRDIINLWIGRMLFLGYYFMEQLPFTDIYLHGTILDKHGHRMSKSRGNGIDPRDLQAEFGTDATRWSIIRLASRQDIRWQADSPARSSRSLRKLYNASKLLGTPLPTKALPQTPLQFWIESKFENLLNEWNAGLDMGEWHRTARAAEHFLEFEFCPWYLEAYKADKENEDKYARHLLYRLLCLTWQLAPNMSQYLLQDAPIAKATAYAYQGSTIIENTFTAIKARRRSIEHQTDNLDLALYASIR